MRRLCTYSYTAVHQKYFPQTGQDQLSWTNARRNNPHQVYSWCRLPPLHRKERARKSACWSASRRALSQGQETHSWILNTSILAVGRACHLIITYNWMVPLVHLAVSLFCATLATQGNMFAHVAISKKKIKCPLVCVKLSVSLKNKSRFFLEGKPLCSLSVSWCFRRVSKVSSEVNQTFTFFKKEGTLVKKKKIRFEMVAVGPRKLI